MSSAAFGRFLRSYFGTIFDPALDILRLHVGIEEDLGTAAIVVLLITVLLLLLIVWSQWPRVGQAVLIVGLSDAGKTLIFSQLVHKRMISTHTSVKENSGIYRSKNGKSLFIVDLPGHERLRMRYVNQYKLTSRGLIFVVDSTTVQVNLKDTAEFLYSLLNNKDIVCCQNVLIACNKQDMPFAKSSSVVKTQLEKEMNMLRITQEATLDLTDSAAIGSGSKSMNKNTFLGKRGKEFEFSHVQPFKIKFAECAAISTDAEDDGDQCDISALENWLAKIA